ncbi:hypothetical protein AZI85_13005 [Bdellovibrio bacteriovorus]|uniref:Uncharacterized protein n=1 Tax=Bdellovibrio bacteriovorus TaxID=959 RepID=A0A150WBI5_BDEBC|nr:hypothetical protein [Bdellovibrio bacteriovorus]KYG60385.1 hypothetical protein AZI85_13005 [Bdellovibrio bacteriovorus]
MRSFLIIASVLFSISSFAADIEPYFESLKQTGVNYEPDGAICEQVAKLRYRGEYPDAQFLITTGVEYSTGDRTLGELDIVVIDRGTQKVILVSEVKCWKNFQQALDKAKSQRLRFQWNLEKHPQQMRFDSYEGLPFSVSQFDGSTQYRSLSQAGGVNKGFDAELELTLSELKQLRMKLLKCQAWGECRRPE